MELEKIIKDKIRFFYKPNKNCEKIFDGLVEIPDSERYSSNSKKIVLKKSDGEVSYDSLYEKKVLEDLDRCSFIKKIKTQSIVIEYKSKLSNRIKKYFPDIQLLLCDGTMVIIEIKPFKEMVNRNNIWKHDVLKRYCQEHKYGYAIFDQDYYSFEDLKKEVVSEEIQEKFIEFVKEKKKVTFAECRDFKKENNINDYQICFIIWKKRRLYLKYLQYYITYKKKEKLLK